jgi:hypothetical protein
MRFALACRKRFWNGLAGIALTFLAEPAAIAIPITYVFSGPATGTLGTTAFTGAQVTVTATADTANITTFDEIHPGDLCMPLTSVAIDIAGIGSTTTTGPSAFADCQECPIWGLVNGNCPKLGANCLVQANNLAAIYGLITSLGPTTGAQFAGGSIPTTSGTLTFTTVPLTFQATLSSLSPDLNQHGFTGSWYNSSTNGQGVEVEVYPNLSPGAGFAQVSWFTFDTAAGGADHERWYTLSGAVAAGQPNAALTIYQNTGGNFNALPMTTAQAVGTATLSFATCTSGQLSYNFTDGSGRTGNIPLTRLTQNVSCATTDPFPTNTDFAHSGNWYDSAKAGQGFTVEVNPISGALFAAWYTYAPIGAAAGAAGQRWYTAQAAFTAGMRSIPVTIYETTGGVFNTPQPAAQTVAVGTGTLAFQSCTAATFNYHFTGGSSSGLSGTINLSRVGPVPPGCTL